MGVNFNINKFGFERYNTKNHNINFCGEKETLNKTNQGNSCCENPSDILIRTINKDTVEISSKQDKVKKRVKISDFAKNCYFNLTTKTIPNITPLMQIIGDKLIPATALSTIFNALYGGLISFASIQNLLYDKKQIDFETVAEIRRKECQKEFTPEDFELAQKRGLFKPDFRKTNEYCQFEKEDISALVKLNNEQFERAKELFYIPERNNSQLDGESIAELVKLPDESYNYVKKLISSETEGYPNYSGEMILKFAKQYNFIQKAKELDSYIKEQIDKIYDEKAPRLSDIIALAGAIHEIKLKSSQIISPYSSYIKNPISQYLRLEKEMLYEEEKKQLELERKFYCTKEFVKHNPESPISKNLYKNYYLKELQNLNVDKKVIDTIRNFYDKYNIQIYINIADLNISKFNGALNGIEEELTKWIKASKGKAKMPPVIDFCMFKPEYTSEYNKYGPILAFSESSTGSLNFRNQNLWTIAQNIRHELVHTNDTKKGFLIDKKKYNLEEIIPKGRAYAGKYYSELEKAGIPYGYIEYGNQDTEEYIAVAAEGDTSKYSKEFKEVLVGLGLPEWIFDLDK